MSKVRSLMIAAATAAVALLTVPAAHAETWVGDDPAGDVHTYTYSPDPRPCGSTTIAEVPDNTTNDITKLSVVHGPQSIRVRVHYRDLLPTDLHSTAVTLRSGDKTWEVEVFRSRSGETTRTYVARVPTRVHPDECGDVVLLTSPLQCRGLSGLVDADADVVRVRLPRSCIHDPSWVRVGASTYSFKAGVSANDQWDPDGTSAGGFWGPFGPRVDAG